MKRLKKRKARIIADIKNQPLRNLVRGAVMWSSVILSSILTSITILFLFPFVYPFDKQRHSLHCLGNYFGKINEFLNPWWKFNIIGKENLAQKNEAVIYVANHQSQADILAIFLLNTRFRWLSKASVFNVPFLGWAMSAIGYVPVLRGDKKSSERCMKIAARHLRKKTPMIFFPEGTRSETGELKLFKKGAFKLAVANKTPIIPITIDGTQKLLPKGSILPSSAEVTIHIHAKILPENLSSEELMVKIHNVISEQLKKNKLMEEGGK